MPVRIALAFALTLLSIPKVAHAECFVQTAKFVMGEPSIELVFSGQVVEVARSGEWGSRVTFEVNRVWKGSVPERLDLYVRERSSNAPRFQEGERYVALAAKLKDAPSVRAELGLSQSKAPFFIAMQCSDRTVLAPNIERDLGSSYEPKRLKE